MHAHTSSSIRIGGNESPQPGGRPPSLAWWDRGVLLLAAATLVTYVYGPFRPIAESADTVISWPRLVALLAIVVVLRHAASPSPSLPAVARRWLGDVVWPDGSPAIWRVGLASRAAVLALGLAVSIHAWPFPEGTPQVSASPVWNLPARWDAFWYLDIARAGYEWDPSLSTEQWRVAFFPAHPVVMRVAGELVTLPAYWFDAPWLFGGDSATRVMLGGVIAAVVAFLWGLSVVYRLARDDVGEVRAVWAVALLAYFPFALFYSVPYTEGLFLLASASAFLAMRQERLLAVFVWGAVAALTRQTGVLLCLPLAMLACTPWPRGGDWRDRAVVRRIVRRLVAAGGPAGGAAIHLAYLGAQFGDPFAFARAQEGWWHSASAVPFVAERVFHVRELGVVQYLAAYPGPAVGTVVPVAALALLWRTWKIAPAYAALVLVTFVPAVAIDTPSIGRMAAPLFPLFIAGASLLPSRRSMWITLGAFGLLQLWAASEFFTWGLLY